MTTTNDVLENDYKSLNLETLELQINDQVAVIHLNRPPVNALSSKLFEELYDTLDLLDNDEHIKAVVVIGKGERAFAAGADITEMTNLDAAGISRMNNKSRRTFEKLENLSKPVIAGINGLALGGGLELALCCDFRISSDHAKFALPEINLAIIPGGGGTQRLPRLIGLAKAKELLYFGDMIAAQDAHHYGLINKVVEWDRLHDTCMEWAAKLANKPAVAMRMMKTAVNVGANMDISSALIHEAACFGNTFATEDREEGMRAFVEKRKPTYKDK